MKLTDAAIKNIVQHEAIDHFGSKGIDLSTKEKRCALSMSIKQDVVYFMIKKANELILREEGFSYTVNI